MKFNLEKLKGSKEVFGFSLRQMMLNKANMILAMIMVLLLAAAPPVFMLIVGDIDKAQQPYSPDVSYDLSQISNVYYKNESGIELNLENVFSQSEVNAEQSSFSPEDYKENLGQSDIFFHIYFSSEKGVYSVDYYTLDSSLIDGGQKQNAAALVYSHFSSQKFSTANITAEQIALIGSTYNSSVTSESAYLNRIEDDEMASRMFIQYAYALIFIVLSTFSSAFIIRAIVEEKASKLVENLLLSVKPLALLIGKILASMVYVSTLMISMFLSFWLSSSVTSAITQNSVIDMILTEFSFGKIFANLDITLILSVVFSLFLSYTTVSIISGISGASCSGMEDIESASVSVTFLILSGYLVSSVTVPLNINALAVSTSLIPIISSFCAPVYYMVGDISFGLLALSWLIQIAVIIGLSMLAAKIYADLIIHKGSKLKLPQLLSMAFKKGGDKQ